MDQRVFFCRVPLKLTVKKWGVKSCYLEESRVHPPLVYLLHDPTQVLYRKFKWILYSSANCACDARDGASLLNSKCKSEIHFKR